MSSELREKLGLKSNSPIDPYTSHVLGMRKHPSEYIVPNGAFDPYDIYCLDELVKAGAAETLIKDNKKIYKLTASGENICEKLIQGR